MNRQEVIEAATTMAATSAAVFDPKRSAIIPKADLALLYSFAGKRPADFYSHVYDRLQATQSYSDCVIADAILERALRQLVGGAA